MCNRIELKVNDMILARLELLSGQFGITKQQILLSALGQFMPSVQPSGKTRAKPKAKQQKTLGEGNRPKSLKEVVEYFQSKNVCQPIEPKAQAFYDYYASKGWVVGKSPIVNWGLCLTQWMMKHPDWRTVPQTNKSMVNIEKFLKWAEKERKPIFEKYRGVTDINDVDQLYIDEYAANNS